MFNNHRYKFSQTEEESTEENPNISFVDFLSKLQYYRFGTFREDNSSVQLARTLFPYYLQDNSHENLLNIGFAISHVPGGDVSKVVEFYNYLKGFDNSKFKDPQYIYNVTHSFGWKDLGLNIDNLDASLKEKFIEWLYHLRSADVQVELINKLLTYDNQIINIFIHSNPILFTDLQKFYETYPDYFLELVKNPHLNRPMITNFIENPNLMKNFDTINRIYFISENSVVINRYLANWGENLDLSDLSEEEFRIFANNISFYDENSATLSPDIIKMVIKSHNAYEYITKISTQDYPFLFTVYSLKKLTGNNFDDLIDSFESNYGEELQSKKGILTSGFLTENLKEFNPILENANFTGIKGFYAPHTILGFLAAVPEENLKLIVDNNNLRGMFKYIDYVPGIYRVLSEFEKNFIGKVPYDVLKLFKKHAKNLDQEEIKKASDFVMSIANDKFPNLLNKHVEESGLSWTDPQTIYYSYLNSKKFANIPVSEYFDGLETLKQLFPDNAVNNKNETGDSVFELSIAPYFIALFGKNIPQKISEAFDKDTINFEFYDFRQALNNISIENSKILGNYIIANQEILAPWQIKLLIRNAEYFKNVTDKFDSANPEIIYRLPPAKLFNYLSRNLDEPEIESKIDAAFQNIYRTVEPNSELYNIMQLIMNRNIATIGSSPKAFSYVFDKISELKNENIDNAAKIVAMFNKKSELYLKKYDNNVHDAAQIIPNTITDRLKLKGADFVLKSNLTREKLSTILESFDLVSDEDLLMPETDLYNKIFLANVKRNATKETKSDDFLLEFSSHGLKIETYKAENFIDISWFDEYEDEEVSSEENYVTYETIENLYLRSLSIPLPDWARNFSTSATYNKKELVGYFLPRQDTRGMFLGKYTGCCQHPDGEGWTCSILGQISENSCFFVVENPATKEIVCQSWVYKLYGSDGNISWGEDLVVFDNVEAINIGTRMSAVVDIYNTVAKHIAQFGYTVILGDTGDINIDHFPNKYNGNFDVTQLKEDTESIYQINVDVYTDASSARVLAEYSYDDEEEEMEA